jgi:hypothetical protein
VELDPDSPLDGFPADDDMPEDGVGPPPIELAVPADELPEAELAFPDVEDWASSYP